MFSIKVEDSFSAAHNLRGYKGKCEELHGHNWKVEIVVTDDKLDKLGMVLDFKSLKKKLYAVLEKLDHKYLNNIPYFKKINPTSENIARFIFGSLKSKISNLKSVTVWESESSSVTYEE
jgi:6-pyruvoyltetrahydropterin/6-carboxytetrahydropterin synthase